MKDLIYPTKAVYAYYFPEVREVISKVTNPYPHEVYLESITPGLDDYHYKAINAYLEASKDLLPGLKDFPYRYTSAGASESIFHILAYLKTYKSKVPIYIFEGEYEGYSGYAKNIGVEVKAIPFDSDLTKIPKGIFFLSNPSARNGAILDKEFIKTIGDGGHRIILDASYVGLTSTEYQYIVSEPAIDMVLVSLSKPYGLYYYRIGFCFSKIEILTLSANKWFKNILSHIIAEQLLKTFPVGILASKYSSYQIRACAELSKQLEISVTPADVILLGLTHKDNIPESKKEELKDFKRGDYYRFGLTPYFLKYEKEQQNEIN